MSLTWSQMAFAADIALDSFRALMTAAPRCCTVWERGRRKHQCYLVMIATFSLIPSRTWGERLWPEFNVSPPKSCNNLMLALPILLEKENCIFPKFIICQRHGSWYKSQLLCYRSYQIRLDHDWLTKIPKVCSHQSNCERPALLEGFLS